MDFSAATHLSSGFIRKLSAFPEKHYHVFEIPKRSGGTRTIAQPSAELKALQGWILNRILNRMVVSPACKGFELDTCIAHNARPHIGAKAIMCLDLDDFFPSVKSNRVYQLFRVCGYGTRISAILTSLCSWNNALPQGSPASPKLANLVCLQLDARLLGYVGKRGIIYTRYADDLTFSTFLYRRLVQAYPFIRQIIESEGFRLNHDKTRFAGPARQHRVTGLVVNDTDAGIGRTQFRELRAKINHLCTYPEVSTPGEVVEHVRGWLAFVKSVDEKRFAMLKEYVHKLQIKYPASGVCMLRIHRQPAHGADGLAPAAHA